MFFQGNSLGLLIGSGSSASSFYLYFSYSVSLGETLLSPVVLEGYLYVGVSLCSLCGFNIFGARAVLSMDACCLFPQCVLAVIPLIGGVRMRWLVPGRGVLAGGGGSCTPPEHMMGAEVPHDDSWSSSR